MDEVKPDDTTKSVQIAWTVSKSTASEPNTATITLSNLSPRSRDSLLDGPDVLVHSDPEPRARVARFDESEFDGDDVWGGMDDLTGDDDYVVSTAADGTPTLVLRSELAAATKGAE
jgi:hypothetical protein